jgi:hypothetical protein
MNREDDQPLWDLLGKAVKPEVSAFFARNVLRKIREEESGRGYLARLFSGRRWIPAAALALAMFAALIVTRTSLAPHSKENPAIAAVATQDYEVVADLDDLLASDENNLWTDNSSL